MNDDAHELIPSARRLMHSLRDMGYDFPAAVADVVDNSIEAKATKVVIDVGFLGDDSWVRIADNGTGMTPTELREAMRYGSDRDYDLEDLGRFGLGMKTASMSQCQRLTVASRSSDSKADIYGYVWDLEHIETSNRWEILPVDRQNFPPILKEPLLETTGTVVLWERLDRILGYKHPYGESSKRRLGQMCRELEQHLAMVFHRFLAGGYSKKLRIELNGNRVEPWDPFARDEPNTKKLDPVIIPFEYEGRAGKIVIEPFVLPNQAGFSSPDAHQKASGPDKWNRQQGFYIYRAGRMIQSGGWCGLRTLDEHTKLARIALLFTPQLDESFKINVSKMRVQLPSPLKPEIEKAIAPAIKLALSTYRKTAPKTSIASTPSGSVVVPDQSETAGPTEGKGGAGAKSGDVNIKSVATFDEFAGLLRAVADPSERAVVERVLGRAEKVVKRGGT